MSAASTSDQLVAGVFTDHATGVQPQAEVIDARWKCPPIRMVA
jgi:hypothetical protein